MTTRTLVLELESPILVGGHTSPTSEVDATTAMVGEALIVPASALRGALREACTRLENAQREASGEPVTPEDVGPLTRELFGAPGPDRPNLTVDTEDIALQAGAPDAKAGAVRVTDAKSRSALALVVRHGVGIDRQTGSAYPEHHFQREVGGAPGHALEAELEVQASAGALELLEAAIALVTGIGNSQSRGLGQVRVSLQPARASGRERAVVVEASARLTALAVDILALEPLLLGGLPSPSNVRESLSFVPGSALRGALADAALRSGVSEDDPAFRAALVDPATCMLFADAHPTDPTDGARDLPLPAPRSRLACKHADDRTHQPPPRGVTRDTLVSGALVARALAQGGRVEPWRCPVCERPLTGAKGTVPRVDHARRVVTRLARDVATGSVAPGLLYSTVQLEPNARFRGTVARVDEAARALLARITADVRLGGLRNRGLGRVRVTLAASIELGAGAVGYRRRKMLDAIGRGWDAADPVALGLPPARQLLAVVARTDLAVPPEEGPAAVGRAIFGDAAHEALAVAQAADVRSGWCTRTPGPRALRPVVAAGSAWLFGFEGEGPADAHLAALELEGVGDLRELGLGRLVFAHTALREGW